MKVSNAEEEEEEVDKERGHWSIVILHVQLTTAFAASVFFSVYLLLLLLFRFHVTCYSYFYFADHLFLPLS